MQSVKNISLRLVLLGAIVFAANLIYKKTFWKSDLRTANVLLELNNAQDSADIIYIGESSNTTTHPADSSKKSISAFTADYFPSLKLRQIQKEATHAGNYVFLVQHLKENSRIKTVIVTMNLRSFDATWINSRLESSLENINILLQDHPPLVNRFLLSLSPPSKKTEKEREDAIRYHLKNDPLNFPYPFKYANAFQWDSTLSESRPVNPDGSRTNPKIELGCHYVKAYAFDIDTNSNPRIKDFDKIVDICRSKKINLVFNLMAENVENADSLVGKDLGFLMKRNRDRLVKRYTERGALVVDNLELVRGKDFIDQSWTTEHYNQRGRIIISANLANRLKQLYPSAYTEIK